MTEAQESAEKDYRDRVRRYTISMIIRVVCLLLAFVVSGWLRWVMVAGAVVLPYVAVLIANAKNERLQLQQMAEYREAPPEELEPGGGPAGEDGDEDEERLIPGEVVEAPESAESDETRESAERDDDDG